MSINVEDINVRKSLGTWKPNHYLSNLSIAYYEDATFANKRLFPSCPVDFPSGHYYEFKKGDLARDNMQIKPPHGSVAPAVFGINENSYSCKVHQVIIAIDKIMVLPYQRSGAPGSIDPIRARTKLITEQIASHQEIEFAKNFFKTGVWTNEWQGAAAADSANKKFLKFDDSASDPVELFDTLAIDIRRNGRRRPNKLALGIETFKALKNNKFILDRIKYSGTTQNPAIVSENVLAQVFGVDQVVVLDATYNDAPHGAADNMQFTCDSKGALLLFTPDTPAIDMPSAGYIFNWKLDAGDYIGIEVHEGAPATHTTLIEGIVAFDMKITGQDMAVYLSNCVG